MQLWEMIERSCVHFTQFPPKNNISHNRTTSQQDTDTDTVKTKHLHHQKDPPFTLYGHTYFPPALTCC